MRIWVNFYRRQCVLKMLKLFYKIFVGVYMKRKVFLVTILVVIIVLVLIFLGVKKYIEKKNKDEIDSAIHGVVISSDVPFYAKAETENVKQLKLLNKGEKVYILDEFEDDGIEWYKIKVDERINGFVRAENVEYYKEINSEKVLVSDVSQFNINKNFKNMDDFEVFLLKNKISYVYIRAGGRGYGEKGNFYYDKNYEDYIKACEYLKIPYGFYFLDEALNDKEIDEEVDFIKEFLKKNGGKYCLLPVALDVEKHDGAGRADNIWNDRAKLVQILIDRLNEEGIDNILYSNAQTANLYLSDLKTKFWLAYYPEEGKVPDYWYFDTNQEGASNTKLQKRMIGWQFTEHGAGDEISEDLDLSLMKKRFFD